MSLNCKLQISINNISNEKAKAVEKALEPDNINFPKGLSLKVEKIDNKLVFNFLGFISDNFWIKHYFITSSETCTCSSTSSTVDINFFILPLF